MLSEAVELGNEAACVTFRIAALVVVPAQIAVGLSGGEHVPIGDEDGMLDGAESAAVADTGRSLWYWACR